METITESTPTNYSNHQCVPPFSEAAMKNIAYYIDMAKKDTRIIDHIVTTSIITTKVQT